MPRGALSFPAPRHQQEPLAWLGQAPTRSFSMANYVGKADRNEKSEEVLQVMEVKDYEKDTPPQRHVLDQNGERPSSAEDTEWSDEMTKGESYC